MADKTPIEWSDATWNIITGCTLVSEGCRHCYAARLAATRLREHPSRKGLARANASGEAKFTGEVRFNEDWLDQPLRWRRPRRVFVCAHGDLFHESVPDEWIDRVFAVMALAPQHTFQVLTKRPERMQAYLAAHDAGLRWRECLPESARGHIGQAISWTCSGLPNVWLGTSVEDQATADARIPHLLATPAAVRFVSAEPLLGSLDLRGWVPGDDGCQLCDDGDGLDPPRCQRRDIPREEQCPENWEVFWNDRPGYGDERRHLDWVIVGGESGPGARPMHPDWARSLRDQCQAAGVPFFFKQMGSWRVTYDRNRDDPDWRCCDRELHRTPRGQWLNLAGGQGFHGERVLRVTPTTKTRAGRLLDGRTWDEMPEAAR